MRIPLDVVLKPVVQELSRQGFEVIRFGDCPPWMERVESLPAPLYRMKQIEEV